MKINVKKLKSICNLDPKSVFKLLEKQGGIISQDKQGNKHGYLDNDSNILAVCHVDTVQSSQFFKIKKELILSPRLDDRLGIYTSLFHLPKMGIKLDILLTDNEEIGQTTASNFVPKKDYHWIVGFDRKGTGVVLYNYDSVNWKNAISDFFAIQQGTYSDISELEDLKISAVNVGIGYHNEHSKDAYMVKKEFLYQIECFEKFYKKYKNTVFPHVPSVGFGKWTKWTNNDSIPYDSYWKDAHTSEDIVICPHCGQETDYENLQGNNIICENCLQSFPFDSIPDEIEDTVCYYCDSIGHKNKNCANCREYNSNIEECDEVEDLVYCPHCENYFEPDDIEFFNELDYCPKCYNVLTKV